MGTVTFRNHTLDDHVLLKSDGFPTYHLAFAVDDHAMRISHVIRGDGWLPSAPKHLLLFQAFNWLPPAFGHLPLVLGPDKKPLAKRHGAKDVLEYREAGYLPEAVDNFLAFLGWSPGTEEDILTMDQLIQKFSIEKIQPSPAMANLERLEWLNGQFIRRLSPGRAATAGVNQAIWDARDDKAAAVAAGSYLIHITASTPEGETARIVQPFIIVR